MSSITAAARGHSLAPLSIAHRFLGLGRHPSKNRWTEVWPRRMRDHVTPCESGRAADSRKWLFVLDLHHWYNSVRTPRDSVNRRFAGSRSSREKPKPVRSFLDTWVIVHFGGPDT